MSLGIGGFVFLSNRRGVANRFWLLTNVLLAIWSLGLFGVISAQSEEIGLQIQNVIDVSGIFIPVAFFNFIAFFLKKDIALKRQRLLLWLLAAALTLLSLTGYYKVGVSPKFGFNFWVDPGQLYFIFPVIFAFLVGYTLFILITEYLKSSDLVLKQQIKYIIGAQIFGFFGGATNFLPQLFGIYPVGNYLIILYVVFISYAIFKHHLFNIKVVATELFTGILIFLLFLNIFSSKSTGNYALSIGIFLGAVILGIMLIRSVIFEVTSREKIAKLAEQLKLANAKLQEVDKVKTEFISIASHQLRTPLTIIKGYTSMALEGSFGRFTKEQHDVIDKLSKSAERLINLIEDLLNISRLEQGRIEYEYKVMNIVPLVEGVVEELQPKADKKGLKLTFVPPARSVPRVRADEQKIRQVFINLVDNSIKYTERGNVAVAVKPEETKVLFTVTDTGIGIAQDDLSTLFKKFVRGSHVSQMYTEGVGLGLYFARKVVENHGGKIWAESAGKGQGSVFTVELPMAS